MNIEKNLKYKNDDNLISIYTTIFNVDSYRWNCIENILNQTYQNFEWIIVFDKDVDKSLFEKLVKNDNRVHFFKNKKGGRCNALNLAVLKCNSNYIFNQDFDDLPNLNRIQLQLEKLKNNQKLAAVGGWYFANYLDINALEKHYDRDDINSIKWKLSFSLPFAHTFCGFRKSAIIDIGMYPLDSNQEDGIVWAKLISKGYEVGIVEENIGTHFIYSNSTYGPLRKKLKWELKFVREKLKIRSILKLPFYHNFFIALKFFYRYLPQKIKRFIRIKMPDHINVKKKNEFIKN